MHISRNVHFRPVHPLAIWQGISQKDEDKGDYHNILKIIHLANMYPLSNAACERSFLVMKREKSDWRCNLSTVNENIDNGPKRLKIFGHNNQSGDGGAMDKKLKDQYSRDDFI